VTTNRVTFDPRVKNVTQDIRLFVGSQATRALEQGAELNASMVRRLPLVNKGSVVTLFARVNDGPYSVQMTGTALNDATNGDIVDVEVKSQDPKSQALKILKTGVAVGTNLVEMK